MRRVLSWVVVAALLAWVAVDLYWHVRFDVCIRREIFHPLYLANVGWIVPATLAFAVLALMAALAQGSRERRPAVKPFLAFAIVASVAIFAGLHSMELLQ